MAIETGLEGKPWWYGAAIGAVVAAVVLGVTWYYFISPMSQQLAAQEAELQRLQRELAEGQAAAANLPRFREEVRALELELDKLLRILPARRNTQDLIRRIRLLVERGDFDLKSFEPGNPTERDFYAEWPIKISLDGTYHNLALFFDRISRFSRIINIEDLQVKALRNPTGQHSISASFTAKTFMYKELEEPTDGDEGEGPS